MLVNRQYELRERYKYRHTYVMRFENEGEDKPEIVKVTGVRQFNGNYNVHVNAIVHEESGGMDSAPRPEPVSELWVELVHPGTVLQNLNASDYLTSLEDGTQVFVRLDYK